MFVDYYKILDLSTSASKVEIKSAYKREAIKWHPDKNNTEDTTTRMQLINEAYLILYDDEARERYDIEYSRYNSHKIASEVTESENTDLYYSVKDELLMKWIQNARKQAANLAKQALEDLVEIGTEGAKGAFRKAGSLFLGFIVLAIIVAIIQAITG